MPSIRVHYQSNFTVVPNEFLRRADLKRDTKFLLIELISHSDEYDVNVSGLVACGQEGRSAVRRMVSDLEDVGLLHRFRERDEDGQLQEAVWVTSYAPITREEAASCIGADAKVGKPYVGQSPTKKEQPKEESNERPSHVCAKEKKSEEYVSLDRWLMEQLENMGIEMNHQAAANVSGQVLSAMMDANHEHPRREAQQYLAERVVEMGLRDTPPDSRGVARFLVRDVRTWEPARKPAEAPAVTTGFDVGGWQ